MDDYKNALPWEVERPRRDDEDEEPRPLHTQADKERPLSAREAAVAGIGRNPETAYGDDSIQPNREDRTDVEQPPDYEQNPP